MKLHSTIFVSALSIAWGVCVFAAEDDFVSPLLGFYEAGVMCAHEGGAVRMAPDTLAGSTHVVEEAPAFVSTGRLVPAVLGIGFGVRSGLDADVGQEGVLMTVTHPPLEGGATQQSFTTVVGSRDFPGVTFYQFDYPYELALGEWTMSATYGAVTLYETTFTVVPPAALPELAGVCGYLDLIG
ncbi:DUF3859 domain-containing protein [Octadecabacter ascidiaceicola]|uniref:DUF3859 domain-containing protein n=1 Tax=Octadecabacter ascidiaceicola TaxID=1655543 RepID=A0A238KA62_9RHOB|nr:DUF3859 domain-containing protein [Octadecabacter ascidiaceicola]SMX39778.1 hypothetical protein OCA8868_02127 [Octadecabacter ascidiaceicola]